MKFLSKLVCLLLFTGVSFATVGYPSYYDSLITTRAHLSAKTKADALNSLYKHVCITETGYAGCYDAIADSTATIDGVTVLTFSDAPATGRWVRSSQQGTAGTKRLSQFLPSGYSVATWGGSAWSGVDYSTQIQAWLNSGSDLLDDVCGVVIGNGLIVGNGSFGYPLQGIRIYGLSPNVVGAAGASGSCRTGIATTSTSGAVLTISNTSQGVFLEIDHLAILGHAGSADAEVTTGAEHGIYSQTGGPDNYKINLHDLYVAGVGGNGVYVPANYFSSSYERIDVGGAGKNCFELSGSNTTNFTSNYCEFAGTTGSGTHPGTDGGAGLWFYAGTAKVENFNCCNSAKHGIVLGRNVAQDGTTNYAHPIITGSNLEDLHAAGIYNKTGSQEIYNTTIVAPAGETIQGIVTTDTVNTAGTIADYDTLFSLKAGSAWSNGAPLHVGASSAYRYIGGSPSLTSVPIYNNTTSTLGTTGTDYHGQVFTDAQMPGGVSGTGAVVKSSAPTIDSPAFTTTASLTRNGAAFFTLQSTANNQLAAFRYKYLRADGTAVSMDWGAQMINDRSALCASVSNTSEMACFTDGGLLLDILSATNTGDVNLCASTGGLVRKGAVCGTSLEETKNIFSDYDLDSASFMQLKPIVFQYKMGRTNHVGLGAHNVVDALGKDCGAYDDKGNMYNYEDRCVTAAIIVEVKRQEREIQVLFALVMVLGVLLGVVGLRKHTRSMRVKVNHE